ncbi:hypothetical protein NC796_06870 [Aliifodinibius sp. S!AR15-10]|uniref:hypothetical protein n=1 Tax=Aliifodinibius sp. S!AR15-10 TaxID=2950437 RepID=UPI0028545E8E|nr:hypothetical protein [Aliifodinibius sp. S!AR15-10]MDR8390851.1 hypothetical protein [Aliifodinibius sp. S!AR15-10]
MEKKTIAQKSITRSMLKFTTLAVILLLADAVQAFGQSKITFRVNLTPQLEDSVFVPGRDQIYIQGNLYPLNRSQKNYLQDIAPADSIYETTVDFGATTRGDQLNYNYIIVTPEKVKREHVPRTLKLQSREQELDVLYFDSFAW